MRAPQIPNATVSGSPRSIGRSPGLSNPNRARGPAVSMRWHDSGVPFHSSRRTASRSVMPGRSPVSRLRTPCEVWQAAHSKAASCSTSLTTRRPSAASMKMSVAFSTSPAGPVATRSSSTRKAGASIVRRDAYVFHPTTPTRRPVPMPASPRTSASAGDASRGWLGRLRSWNRTQRAGSGAASAVAEALVAGEEDRVAARRHDHHGLLEARIEPAEVGEVGAVLAVGPDHQRVVVACGHPVPDAVQPFGVDRRREHRLGRRHPEVGQRDLRQPGPARRRRRHRCPSGVHGVALVAPRSIVANSPAGTVIHGPVRPSGHVTRTSASSASPRPTWIQPSCPPA